MAHNAPPPGETAETRMTLGLSMIKEGKDHVNLGNFAMDLAVGDEGVQILMSAMSAQDKTEFKATKLTLYGNHLGPSAAAAVAEMVTERRSMRVINLQTNLIGVEGAKSIAGALESDSCGVTKVCLGWTQNLGDEGATAIAKALIHNRSVTSMNLPDCGITDKGAMYFAEALRHNPVLTRIDLEDNKVSPEITTSLRDACLINQKRIKVPWSQRQHHKFPKEFKNQICAIIMLGEVVTRGSKVAHCFANLPHDISTMLFQVIYDMQWHTGAKDKVLEGVMQMLTESEKKEEEKKNSPRKRATRSSTRKKS